MLQYPHEDTYLTLKDVVEIATEGIKDIDHHYLPDPSGDEVPEDADLNHAYATLREVARLASTAAARLKTKADADRVRRLEAEDAL